MLGRRDGTVMRQEALDHACAIVAATDLPVSADLEKGFDDAPEGVEETIRLAATVGLVGTRSTVSQWFARSRERQALREIAERNVLL